MHLYQLSSLNGYTKSHTSHKHACNDNIDINYHLDNEIGAIDTDCPIHKHKSAKTLTQALNTTNSAKQNQLRYFTYTQALQLQKCATLCDNSAKTIPFHLEKQ